MRVTRKVGHVTFEHDDEFKGEVTISRGDQTLAVPVQRMKPSELLRRMV
jgi:hypothetical protein